MTSLEVDPGELRKAGNAFKSAGQDISDAHADAPLGDAAAAVPQLRTADACLAARTTIASQMSTIADSVRRFGADLLGAADRYESTDGRSGDAIANTDVPAPAPR